MLVCTNSKILYHCLEKMFLKSLLPLSFLFFSGFAISGKIRIQIGALFENASPAAHRALRLTVNEINKDGSVLPQAILHYVIKNVTNSDSLDALSEGCDLLQIGVMSLVSVTSCSVGMTLQFLSADKRIPLMQVNHLDCVSSFNKYSYSPTSRPEQVAGAVEQLLRKEEIKNFLIIYDTYNDFNIIKAMTLRLYDSLMQKSMPTNFLLRIENSSNENIRNVGLQVQQLFLQNRFVSLQSVIVFTNSTTACNLISQVRDKRLESKLKWIVINNRLTTAELSSLAESTNFTVMVVKQYYPVETPLMQRFITMWNRDVRRDCSACSIIAGDEIPLEAYAIHDGIFHLSKALSLEMRGRNFVSASRITCNPMSKAFWPGGAPIMKSMKQFNTTGLLGEVSLGKDGYNNVVNFEILKKNSRANNFRTVTVWNPIYDFGSSGSPKLTIANTTLKIATVEDAPFVFIKRLGDGKVEFTGFVIDLLDALAVNLSFAYELYEVVDGKYGSRLQNGSWSGLVGEVAKENADIAAAAMTITAEREIVVDFSKRFMDYSVGIVLKRSGTTSSIFSFTNPFHYSVWFCILSSLILIVIFIYILNKINPSRNKSQNYESHSGSSSSLGCAFWFAYSCLMQQGYGLQRATLPVRIVIAFWWFFTFIIASSYTANLAAFFTVKRMNPPVRSFRDLANQQEIKYGTVSDTSIYDYIMKKAKEANDESSMYKKMSKMINISANKISEASNGFHRAASENFAFLWDVAAIEYEVLEHRECAITAVDDSIYEKGYGFALQQESTYRDQISQGILDLQDAGEIERLRKKWWPNSGTCSLDESETSTYGAELTLKNFMGVFFILAVGLFIACMYALIEIILHVKQGKAYPPKENVNESNDDAVHQEGEIRVIMSKKELLRQLVDEIVADKDWDNSLRKQPTNVRRERFISPRMKLRGKCVFPRRAKLSQKNRCIADEEVAQCEDITNAADEKMSVDSSTSGCGVTVAIHDTPRYLPICQSHGMLVSSNLLNYSLPITRRVRATFPNMDGTFHRSMSTLQKIEENTESDGSQMNKVMTLNRADIFKKSQSLRKVSLKTEKPVAAALTAGTQEFLSSIQAMDNLASIFKNSSV